ncbi:PWWP domain-containing protein [Marssonina coronariae]|uniref:PWWP domain-containing protein n=1 Tax=Diplocarpon coronariae TaxID=2795749 RepID=A0A218YYW3_9HELO|nr:PWWP domain-containing protein [Marssonina coronariae]
MSDEASPQDAVTVTLTEAQIAGSESFDKTEVKEADIATARISDSSAGVKGNEEVATGDAPTENTESKFIRHKQTASEDVAQGIASTAEGDIKMTEATEPDNTALNATAATNVTVDSPLPTAKHKGGNRRKSSGVPEHKGKKLNKKASSAKITHTDAKPGDYFYVKLKGYPLWPAIVCDDSMLPSTLLKSRPVTAASADGTYREDYADGGAKVKDRTFPVMYLHTNEFGWIPNYDLVDLDFENVANINSSMRKDLAAARTLAGEQNDLNYFKGILKQFLAEREADRAAKDQAKAEEKAAKKLKETEKMQNSEKATKKKATPKKEKKSVKSTVEQDGDEDTTMLDAGGPESDEAEASSETKGKKRKAEDTPQGSDSIKKPRTTIKLNTKKTTNGLSTPKTPKEATTKVAKPKKTKATPKAPEALATKEPELSAEEKRAKKEKEILFLRHKLQKGLLSRDQVPKEDEMKQMGEFVSKLEGYVDLEVSIIRATKINKVLKAILKLTTLPNNDEFKIKTRSEGLLDEWNKLLASDITHSAAPTPAANGTMGKTKSEDKAEVRSEAEDIGVSLVDAANGTKESKAEATSDDMAEQEVDPEAQKKAEGKVERIAEEKADNAMPSVEEPSAANDVPNEVDGAQTAAAKEPEKEPASS